MMKISVYIIGFILVFGGNPCWAQGEVVKENYDDGTLQRELTYENDEVIYSREFFQDGTLSQEVSYKNGMRDGLVKVYFASGDLAQEGLFKEDKAHGLTKIYYLDGSLNATIEYREGARDGIYRLFFEDGRVKTEARFAMDRMLDVDGKPKTGVQKIFYKSGKIMAVEEYKDGVIDGSIRVYYENGQLKIDKIVKDGQEVFIRKYDDTGVVLFEDDQR